LLPQWFIDEVKKRTNIVELISEYTELEKAGTGVWQGRCPNPHHADKDPSFRVWEKEQSWACMVCHCGEKNTNDNNFGSDCFAFLQWIENIGWYKAVMKLAEKAGIPKPEDKNQAIYNRNKILANSYTKSLHGEAFNYLIDRGLTRKDMEKWLIGFDGIKFTFPLFDRYLNILGFSRRWLHKPEGRNDKYRNPPNGKIFDKSFYLYGIHNLDTSFPEIRITEGPMDAILSDKYGAKNVVATQGTALTDGHISIIKSLNMVPVLCMDGDEAGLKSMKKSVEAFAKHGMYCKILILNDGKDMADMANELQYSIEEYIQSNSITYGQYKLKDILNRYDSQMLEVKIKLYPELLKVISEIPYEVERNVIKDHIKKQLSIDL
jgi:DNA primase